jgi:predicted ATP-binding protein involved in virulence
LVLIDELDAHMHPRWQQVLVSRLKTVFPNIQFIASTHSPLIIGGLDRKEVECFTIRDGKVVKVDFAPDMTLGRTDQILSGELFRLPGTLDPTTKKLIAEYESLLGKSNPGDAEKERLNALARLLEERIPPAPEGMVERRARELLEALQAGDEQSAPPRVQDRMAQLAKALSARPA